MASKHVVGRLTGGRRHRRPVRYVCANSWNIIARLCCMRHIIRRYLDKPIHELLRGIEKRAARMHAHVRFGTQRLGQPEHDVLAGSPGDAKVALCKIALLLGNSLLLVRDTFRRDGNLLGAVRLPPLPAGERHQAPPATAAADQASRKRAALLAHLLRQQVLLRHAVDGGGEVGAGLDEARCRADRRHRDRAGGRSISARSRKRPVSTGGSGIALVPDEIAGRVVPGELAVGERDQERVGALVLEPVGDFLVDPVRRRRLRRGQQDQIARLPSACSIDGHRLGVADRLVSSRKTRSARRRYHGLPSLCIDRLQRRRDRLVLGVAVGDEGVVERH